MALTIQERLKDLRVEKGLTLEELAEETGISKSSLNSYETDELREIGSYAVIQLADIYEVSADYLLGLTEAKRCSNSDIAELNLSDEVIELLQNKNIDTSLFCELVSHKDFLKLLADIHIYVNGIAAMQIQNLNAWTDIAREEIIKKYQPDENDETLYLLKSSHIDEDRYFSQRIYEDMDIIIKDLRKNHEGIKESAPKNSAVNELKESLKEAINFKGSRTEQLLMIFCKQTKLKYNKLTEEEKQWLIKIASKSELIKPHIPKKLKRKK